MFDFIQESLDTEDSFCAASGTSESARLPLIEVAQTLPVARGRVPHTVSAAHTRHPAHSCHLAPYTPTTLLTSSTVCTVQYPVLFCFCIEAPCPKRQKRLFFNHRRGTPKRSFAVTRHKITFRQPPAAPPRHRLTRFHHHHHPPQVSRLPPQTWMSRRF